MNNLHEYFYRNDPAAEFRLRFEMQGDAKDKLVLKIRPLDGTSQPEHTFLIDGVANPVLASGEFRPQNPSVPPAPQEQPVQKPLKPQQAQQKQAATKKKK